MDIYSLAVVLLFGGKKNSGINEGIEKRGVRDFNDANKQKNEIEIAEKR
jgi:hypothetical protein